MAAKTSKANSVSTPKTGIDSKDQRILQLLQQTLYVDYDSYKMEDRTINAKMRTVISCNLYTYTGQLVLLNVILESWAWKVQYYVTVKDTFANNCL